MNSRPHSIISLVFMLFVFPFSSAITPLETTLSNQWKDLNYTFENCSSHSPILPHLAYNRVPHAFTTIQNPKIQKKMFLQFMVPLVTNENKHIKEQREYLKPLYKKMDAGINLTPFDHQWLENRCTEYRLKKCEQNELLKRMDTIPESLVLAQAAIESGWGSSRFAQEGNALFGQWVYNDSIGMIPSQRLTGESHKVGRFNTPQESIRSYFLNLNTNKAYAQFREKRQQLHKTHEPLSGLALTPELIRYSERKERYVDLLESLIKSNNLEACNGIPLASTPQREIIVDAAS